MSTGNMIHQYLTERTGIHTVIATQTPGVISSSTNSFFPYFNIDCSFASSFFCRSMTPRMIFLSSSVRWLRSGISGMAPAAEAVAAAAAAAGPGPPRGPCGADIFYTQWLKIKKREKAPSTSCILGDIFVTFHVQFQIGAWRHRGFTGGMTSWLGVSCTYYTVLQK